MPDFLATALCKPDCQRARHLGILPWRFWGLGGALGSGGAVVAAPGESKGGLPASQTGLRGALGSGAR